MKGRKEYAIFLTKREVEHMLDLVNYEPEPELSIMKKLVTLYARIKGKKSEEKE